MEWRKDVYMRYWWWLWSELRLARKDADWIEGPGFVQVTLEVTSLVTIAANWMGFVCLRSHLGWISTSEEACTHLTKCKCFDSIQNTPYTPGGLKWRDTIDWCLLVASLLHRLPIYGSKTLSIDLKPATSNNLIRYLVSDAAAKLRDDKDAFLLWVDLARVNEYSDWMYGMLLRRLGRKVLVLECHQWNDSLVLHWKPDTQKAHTHKHLWWLSKSISGEKHNGS